MVNLAVVRRRRSNLLREKGYICSVCSSHKAYRPGAFDFVAAYVIAEDVWYIIPAKLIRGLKSISLCTTAGKYEEYREAWKLLREASGIGEEAVVDATSEDPLLANEARSFDSAQDKPGAPTGAVDSAQEESRADHEGGSVDETRMGPGLVRMQNAFAFIRRQLEKGGRVPR